VKNGTSYRTNKGLYEITQPFVGIFESIFARKSISTMETVRVFKPETLLAMVVIALIALIVLKLIKPRAGDQFKRTEYTENKNRINKYFTNQVSA